jgi:hypothetical protein
MEINSALSAGVKRWMTSSRRKRFVSVESSIHVESRRPSGVQGRLGWLMVCTAGFLCAAFGVFLVAAWKNYEHLNPTAGVWTAAAIDASKGVLYRPIESDIGYGGTRYAPLHIVLQGGLIHLGMGPVASGFLLDLVGILMVMGGLYALMRELDVERIPAAGMATFVLSAYCYATTAAGIKGDLLAAAFNLWGLAAVARSEKSDESRRGGLVLAAVCFVLAMAAKLTSIFGIGAAAFWLICRGKRLQALILCAIWATGIELALVITQWASGGRAIVIFRMSALGGGGLPDLLHAPKSFFDIAVHRDRWFACFWIIAAGSIVIGGKWRSLPAILFVLTTIGTVAIFGTPGTNSNHLVDLEAAAVLVIATRLDSGRLGLAAVACATAVACYGGINCLRSVPAIYRDSQHGQMMSALVASHKSAGTGPLLSENPMLPIIDGERPYMIDSFMFRTVRIRHPEIAERFWNDLSQRHFRAVILDGPPTQASRNGNAGDFGPGFIDMLQRYYRPEGQHGEYWVYLPGRR